MRVTGLVGVPADEVGELLARLLGATMTEASLTPLAASAAAEPRVRAGVLTAGGRRGTGGQLRDRVGNRSGTCGPAGWTFAAVYAALLAGLIPAAAAGRR